LIIAASCFVAVNFAGITEKCYLKNSCFTFSGG